MIVIGLNNVLFYKVKNYKIFGFFFFFFSSFYNFCLNNCLIQPWQRGRGLFAN
jgi:hypothetical protein